MTETLLPRSASRKMNQTPVLPPSLRAKTCGRETGIALEPTPLRLNACVCCHAWIVFHTLPLKTNRKYCGREVVAAPTLLARAGGPCYGLAP